MLASRTFMGTSSADTGRPDLAARPLSESHGIMASDPLMAKAAREVLKHAAVEAAQRQVRAGGSHARSARKPTQKQVIACARADTP